MRKTPMGTHKHCEVCGKEIYAPPSQPQKKYCSRECMAEDYKTRLSGAGNPAWRGGRWPYKGKSWMRISREVIARCKVCAYCGGTDELVAHHLIPQRYWLKIDESNVITNLVACCHDCHVRRPEHYWIELPDPFFDPALHSRLPMPRTTTALVPKIPNDPCKVCGQLVKVKGNECCSLACAARLKWKNGKCEILKGMRAETIEKNTKICAWCGKTFLSQDGIPIYCSRACYKADENKRKAVLIPCTQCGQLCKKEPWRIRVSKTGKLFCSDQCRDTHRRTRVTVTCPVCEKPFEIKAYRANDGKVHMCSPQCVGKYTAIKRSST